MLNFVDEETAIIADSAVTPEGYLVVEAHCVRSGIQQYLGSEVGRPDLKFVDVYRPEEEVFDRKSIESFAHKPITVDHPTGIVTAETWRNLAVGEVSTEALRDGERLKLQLIVKDKNAINLIKSHKKRELSAGYSCTLDWNPGVTPDGQKYDAVQRGIRINHLALVAQGRAGNCAIGDSASWGIAPVADSAGAALPSEQQEVQMDIKTIVLGDKAVRVASEDEATVTQHMKTLNDTASTLQGENAALKQQLADAELTPAKIADAVRQRKAVLDGYRKITGTAADEAKPDADLRKEAVMKKLGDAATSMSDEAIAGAFAAFAAAAKSDPIRDAAIDGFSADTTAALADSILAASGLKLKQKEA